jgi:hypothetical protein
MLSTFISLQTSINYHIKKIKAKPLIIVENEDWLCLISCIFLRFNSYANIYIYNNNPYFLIITNFLES